MRHPEFVAGEYDTSFIERHRGEVLGYATPSDGDREPLAVAMALAAARLEQGVGRASREKSEVASRISPWVACHRARRSLV